MRYRLFVHPILFHPGHALPAWYFAHRAGLERVFFLGSLTDSDSELTHLTLDRSIDAEGVPQIAVAALVKRPGETDSRLDGFSNPLKTILSVVTILPPVLMRLLFSREGLSCAAFGCARDSSQFAG